MRRKVLASCVLLQVICLTELLSAVETRAQNPIFKETDVIDTIHAAKAHRDLDRIIELSGKVKRSARLSSRSPHPAQH